MYLNNMKITEEQKNFILNLKSIPKEELEIFKLHIAENFTQEMLMKRFNLTRQKVSNILFDIQTKIINFRKCNLVNEDEVFISRKTKVIQSIKIDEVNSSTIQVTFKGNVIPVTIHRELNIVIDEIKKSHPNYTDNLDSIDYDDDSLTYSLTFTSL